MNPIYKDNNALEACQEEKRNCLHKDDSGSLSGIMNEHLLIYCNRHDWMWTLK
jgi:nitrite reductase/ring-hydroxylating ferredoxin subunit